MPARPKAILVIIRSTTLEEPRIPRMRALRKSDFPRRVSYAGRARLFRLLPNAVVSAFPVVALSLRNAGGVSLLPDAPMRRRSRSIKPEFREDHHVGPKLDRGRRPCAGSRADDDDRR